MGIEGRRGWRVRTEKGYESSSNRNYLGSLPYLPEELAGLWVTSEVGCRLEYRGLACAQGGGKFEVFAQNALLLLLYFSPFLLCVCFYILSSPYSQSQKFTYFQHRSLSFSAGSERRNSNPKSTCLP